MIPFFRPATFARVSSLFSPGTVKDSSEFFLIWFVFYYRARRDTKLVCSLSFFPSSGLHLATSRTRRSAGVFIFFCQPFVLFL